MFRVLFFVCVVFFPSLFVTNSAQARNVWVPRSPYPRSDSAPVAPSRDLGALSGRCPYVSHWIDSILGNQIIKLEDGSEWAFDMTRVSVMDGWKTTDIVSLSPNQAWGSNYEYILTHKLSGSSIPVNPVLGPIRHGTYTLWIIGLNKQLREVYLTSGLNDRTVWHIPECDRYLFDEWEVDDVIMVGENTSWWWWFSPYNFVLINVEMNHYVRAKCTSYY